MPDYQRVVDDLRNAVMYLSGDPSVETIETALGEYREACERTNERLRLCEGLLKKGLRGEAIQYAEIEPNLLDVVAMLDFPERDAVAKTLRQIGLSLPLLYAELAGDLNESYAAQQPLDALLSRHRYLALASAPLKDRLHVLRKIAEADPTNGIWNEDIAVYEQERFKELHSTASKAGRTKDFALLDSCCQELTQTAWQQLPPEAFKKSLTKARDELKRSTARERLQWLEAKINLAHGALDVVEGRRLREQWQEAFAIAQPAADDPLVVRVAPALDWLDDQDRREAESASFKNACAELESALDSETTQTSDRVRLESLYHAAVRHELDLPLHLEERYRSRLAAWELSTTRKSRLRIVALVAVLILVGSGIAFGIHAQTRIKRIRDATAALADLVTAGKADPDAMPAAQSFHTKLSETSPDLAETPTIQQLAGEITAALQREQDRKSRFQEALEKAKEAGPGNPNRAALNEAAELARVDAEKAAVARFQADVAGATRTMQSQRDEVFTAEVVKLAADLRVIQNLGFGDLDRLNIVLNEIRTGVNATTAQHKEISTSTAAQIRPLEARIAALQATADRLRAERTALQAVVNAITNRTAFLEALTKYANEHPTGGRSGDFKQVLAEAARWSQLDEWNQAVAKAEQINGANAKPDEIEHLKVSAKTFERFPQAALFAERADRYERLAARRDAMGVPKVTKLRNMFDNPLMKSAWVVKMRSGDIYYQLAEPVRSATVTQNLAIVLDYALTTKNIIVPTADILSIGPAPHCAMTAAVLVDLDRLKVGSEADWEPCLAKIIRTIYAASDVEPLLRLGLLKKIVETTCQGSAPMQEALKVELGLFENTEANLLVNWMDAKNPDSVLASRTARNELLNMADLSANADRGVAAAAQAQSIVTALPRYELFGCLLSEAEGGWRCAGAATGTIKNGVLVIMHPDVPEGHVVQDIGKLSDGAVQLAASGGSGFVEGRWVWVRPTP